jgi:hypothetical protein
MISKIFNILKGQQVHRMEKMAAQCTQLPLAPGPGKGLTALHRREALLKYFADLK